MSLWPDVRCGGNLVIWVRKSQFCNSKLSASNDLWHREDPVSIWGIGWVRGTQASQGLVGMEVGGLAWSCWLQEKGAWWQMWYLPGMVTLCVSWFRTDKEDVVIGRQHWRKEVDHSVHRKQAYHRQYGPNHWAERVLHEFLHLRGSQNRVRIWPPYQE